MPPLVLKPQVGWIFSFLSYGICRMKRRRIKGLKTPEQTCLALISLFSGTERQKECSKPELLLALMRHKYHLWSSKEIPSYCHCHFSAQHSSFLQEHLAWVPRLRTVHGFTPVRRFLCPECSGALSIHPQPLTLPSSGTGSHTEPSTAALSMQPILPTQASLTAPFWLDLRPMKSCPSSGLLPHHSPRHTSGACFDTPRGMRKTVLLELHHPEQVFSNPITLLHYCRFFSAGPEGA